MSGRKSELRCLRTPRSIELSSVVAPSIRESRRSSCRLLMLSEDAELREVIIELGGLLTLAVESEEESLLRQALNVVADGEVEPIEITLPSPLGERFVFYKLKDIVEKLSSDIMTGEEKKNISRGNSPAPFAAWDAW